MANIIVNCLGIYLLDTAGESADSYVVGNTTVNKAKAEMFLKGEAYIVIRTLTYLTCVDGELVVQFDSNELS